MNTEKAERLRAIADWIAKKGSPDFPTPTITNYIGFLLSLADEVENKPKWSHDSEGNYICNRCGHSDPGFVVSDEIWKKHSGSWHDRVLCVNCFYEMSDMVPTFRATKEQAADEESKPLELDDSEIEKEAKRRGYSEYKSPDSAIAYSRQPSTILVMEKKVKDNMSEIVKDLGNTVTKISKEEMAKTNKKINESMDEFKRELYQKENDSKVSSSKITLR